MHSQGTEEQTLLDIFKDVQSGTALDIGAFDGVTFSNTRALIEEKGWSGVLVEASPSTFSGLMRNCHGMERVMLVNALISPESDDIVQFWDSLGDLISTTEEKNRKVWADSGSKFSKIWSPQVCVERLFQAPFHTSYDFINIDTEGTSTDLFFRCLTGLPLPRAFCVEHDGNHGRIAQLAAAHGYKPRYLDGNNIILERT